MKELILGGARSGKSALAQQKAEHTALPITYIATATADDTEMAQRIAHHQRQRPAGWTLVEEPLTLAEALQQHAREDRLLLVDCLTLWLSNLLASERAVESEIERVVSIVETLPGQIILVSNEVGLGVIPLGELTRRFVDESGRLHQRLAAVCDRVTLVVAGLPHSLKG